MSAIRRILQGCLGLAPEERVVLICDESMRPLATQFSEEIAALGAKGSFLEAPGPSGNGMIALPASEGEGLSHADVILVLTSAPMVLEALAPALGRKARGANLAGVSWEMLERLLSDDPEAVAHKARAFADLLRGGRSFRLAGPGTELVFQARDPVPAIETGLYRMKGAFGDLPAGQVRVTPVSSSVDGSIAVYEAFANGAHASGPFTVYLREGRLARIEPSLPAVSLASLAAADGQVTEVGFGTNPHALLGGHRIEDRKVSGVVDLVFSSASGLKGHILFVPVATEVDGGPIEWAPPPRAPREDGAAAELPGEDFRKLLIENSLDVQYIQDVKTQEFLYVNRAFENLIGYTLAELRLYRITGDRLVAPEDRAAIQERRTKGASVTDRYVFMAVTRTGRRIQMEVSVQRVVHVGRDLALGVAREVTEQKKVEKRLREQVDLQRHQTLGAYQANVRIYQLTEKIRAAYESTRNILKCRTLDEMAQAVVEILCDRGGLNYGIARFYHVDGRWLRKLAASDDLTKKKKVIDLRKNHRLAKIVRGEARPETVSNAQVIPLRVRDETVGLLLLSGRAEEKARIWQDNIVMTLAGLVALMIDNLSLYEKIKAQTVVDPLTHVFNRRHFDEKLVAEMRRAVRYKRELSMAMIDIDDFKKINDTYGHPQGDVVLREVAKILSSWTRSTDFVFRYGGEEFSLILPETPLESAFGKVEGLRTLIEASSFANLADPDKPLRVTVSIGIAGVDPAIQVPEALIQAADQALYRSKREGKNRTTRVSKDPDGPAFSSS